jgi:hypothetical protein
MHVKSCDNNSLGGDFRQLEVEVEVGIFFKEFIGLNRYIKRIQNDPLGVLMCLDNSMDENDKSLAQQS